MSHRCTICLRNWKPSQAPNRCPVCDGITRLSAEVPDADCVEAYTAAIRERQAEAESVKRHADFEAYYAKRDAERAAAESDTAESEAA